MALNAAVAVGFWGFTLASASGLLPVSFHPIDRHMQLGLSHMIYDAKAREHFYREALLHGTLQALNLAAHMGTSSPSFLHISWKEDFFSLRCLKDLAYFLACWVWAWTLVVGACPYPAIPSLPCQSLAVILPILAATHDYLKDDTKIKLNYF